MKRVLFVSPTGGYAGIDVCLETLVLGLDRTRFEPVVVFPLNAFLKQRFEKEGIRCYELPLNWWFPVEFTGSDLLRVLPTLRSKVDPLVQIIRSERIDVVLSNTTVALDGAIAAGICGVPHVMFLHALFVPNIYENMREETRDFLYPLFGKLSEKVVCCSRMLHEAFSAYTDNSMYINNGVDTEKYAFQKRSLDPADPQIRLVCVGHYNANKQQDFVLRALNWIRLERPELLRKITFTMVGPAEEGFRSLLCKLVEEYQLEKNVIMEDFRDDISDYLKNFNLYVNSSLTEGLPLSVMEAMASGLPVLGSVNNGTLQLVEEGVSGFLCEKPEDMGRRLVQLLEAPALLESMSERARERMETHFSSKQYVRAFQELFVEVSEKRLPEDRTRFLNGLYETLVGAPSAKTAHKRVLVVYSPTATPSYMLTVKYPFDDLKKKGLLDYTGVAAMENLRYELKERLFPNHGEKYGIPNYSAVTPERFKKSMLKDYDAVLCVRIHNGFAYRLLRAVRRRHKPFIWVTDDNYSALRVVDGKPVHEEKGNPRYERMFRKSSHTLVYSDALYQFGSRLTRNITRVPTIQPDNREYLDAAARTDRKIVLGFMGTLQRDEDFACVVPALRRVIEKYGDAIRVEFIGYHPAALRDDPHVKCFDFLADYEQFRKFFASRRWDIGLAPLADTMFNRCKTNNKYREYGSFRIAGIYSDIPTYSCVEHGVNGYLTEHTEDGWFNAMCTLIEQKKLREQIAQSALEDVLKNYSVENAGKVLLKVLGDDDSLRGELAVRALKDILRSYSLKEMAELFLKELRKKLAKGRG